ncbi:MAG: hypothetical protein IKO47_03410 [Ruminococcus sp.]|nr:hypothetical protein [Ruminococcus sp.]
MKKILIILKSISTHNRQNALCVEKVANYINSSEYLIDYLSWELKTPIEKTSNTYVVVEKEATDGIANLIRISSKVLRTPIGNYQLVKKMRNKIVELYKINKYDAIISVINPVEGAEALYLAKEEIPQINAILYEIDPNSNRYKICRTIKEKIWQYRSIKWETKIYRSFDHIIHMASHRRHYSADCFSEFKGKSIYLDIPNFESMNSMTTGSIHVPLRLLYCGAFYPGMREPYYMFNLFKEISKSVQLVLDIYTGNSMRSELEEQSAKLGYIKLHNEIPQEQLNKVIDEADILISVGNKDSDFLPSKTLMYMGTSKPIIHFYFDKDDVSMRYFSCYPAVLNVMQEKETTSEVKKRIVEFISKVQKGIAVDQKALKERLYRNTPEYSANQICGLI